MNCNWKKGVITATISCTLLFSYPFQDVQAENLLDIKGHWAEDSITFLHNEGILFPIGSEKFNPQKEITRAEFVSMIVQALQLDSDEVIVQTFLDVDLDAWYAKDILLAEQEGLITGNDGLFRPEDSITRAEIATLIHRAFQDLEAIRPLITFRDLSENHWAYPAVRFASQAGIVVGHLDYTFKPQQHASRAEAAVMISRVLQGGVDHLPPMLQYTVVQGDSLWKIAERYQINLESIIEVNALESDQLSVGQVLQIPSVRNVVSMANMKEPESSEGIELIEWSSASKVFSIGTVATVTDVYTGKTFKVQRTYGTNHADVEPLTRTDTATMNEIWGKYTWDTRPVIVEVDGRRMAAAMHNMPHSVQKITNNGYNGHTCIHFLGSRKHHDGSVWSAMQRDVKIAAGSKE